MRIDTVRWCDAERPGLARQHATAGQPGLALAAVAGRVGVRYSPTASPGRRLLMGARPKPSMSGAPQNLDDLIAAHRTRLRGWIRARVSDPYGVDEVEQETWIEVLRHTFDETLGSFWTFTLIWADKAVKRYFRARGDVLEEVELPDRRPQHDLRLGHARALREFLVRALRCSRPPHEVVALGYVKLGWKPEDIAAQLADNTLDVLVPRLEVEYAALLSRTAAVGAFAPLRGRLTQQVGSLISDPRTRRTYAHTLERRAGDTTLAEYLRDGDHPRDIITRWWDNVLKRVLAEVLRESNGDLLEWLLERFPELTDRLPRTVRS